MVNRDDKACIFDFDLSSLEDLEDTLLGWPRLSKADGMHSSSLPDSNSTSPRQMPTPNVWRSPVPLPVRHPFGLSTKFLRSYCLCYLFSSADTITAPTEEMYAYATRVASLGDDVFSTDECTNALEAHVAKLAGKESGLLVLSGTLSNQLALRTHLTQPPYRCICSAGRFCVD